MASNTLTPYMVSMCAMAAFPSCQAFCDYDITRDEMRVWLQRGDDESKLAVTTRELLLSCDSMTELIRKRGPQDWLPPPRELPLARDITIVDELSGG